jgi:hypothetical protein
VRSRRIFANEARCVAPSIAKGQDQAMLALCPRVSCIPCTGRAGGQNWALNGWMVDERSKGMGLRPLGMRARAKANRERIWGRTASDQFTWHWVHAPEDHFKSCGARREKKERGDGEVKGTHSDWSLDRPGPFHGDTLYFILFC